MGGGDVQHTRKIPFTLEIITGKARSGASDDDLSHGQGVYLLAILPLKAQQQSSYAGVSVVRVFETTRRVN